MSAGKYELKAPPGMPGAEFPPGGPGLPNVPPGLEYLRELDYIKIQQKVEILEAFTGWEGNNKYEIKNRRNQVCFYAFEKSGCCARQCCDEGRGFEMKMVDNYQREVMRVQRDCKCCATDCCWLACCSCTQHDMLIESPPGTVIGKVNNKCSCWRKTFSVSLGDEQSGFHEFAELVGPCIMTRTLCCMCCCGCDITFTLHSSETGEKIGELKKEYSGLGKEVFTDADNFSISFPQDLDVRAKAVLMASTFLIDFMFFEQKSEDEN